MINLFKKIRQLLSQKNIWLTIGSGVSFFPCAILANLIGIEWLNIPRDHPLFAFIFVILSTPPLVLMFFCLSNFVKPPALRNLIRFATILAGVIVGGYAIGQFIVYLSL